MSQLEKLSQLKKCVTVSKMYQILKNGSELDNWEEIKKMNESRRFKTLSGVIEARIHSQVKKSWALGIPHAAKSPR